MPFTAIFMNIKETIDMKMEQAIRAIAGLFILVSLVLSQFHSPFWLYFTAFVGLNLLQSAFTGFCPMETFLDKVLHVRR